MTDQRLLKVKEVAEKLNCSVSTVYPLIHCGDIGHTKVGKGYRIKTTEVDNYLHRNHHRAKSSPPF